VDAELAKAGWSRARRTMVDAYGLKVAEVDPKSRCADRGPPDIGDKESAIESKDLVACPAKFEPDAEPEPNGAGFIAQDRLFFAMTHPGLSGYESARIDDCRMCDMLA
jgi:hypothetical protein